MLRFLRNLKGVTLIGMVTKGYEHELDTFYSDYWMDKSKSFIRICVGRWGLEIFPFWIIDRALVTKIR